MERNNEGEGYPEYKQLKQRMKADFKQIRKAVKKGRAPDTELVRSFCSDAQLMTTYPEKGNEYYPDFQDRVKNLEEAAEQRDWAKLADVVAEVRRVEKECHKRFK